MSGPTGSPKEIRVSGRNERRMEATGWHRREKPLEIELFERPGPVKAYGNWLARQPVTFWSRAEGKIAHFHGQRSFFLFFPHEWFIPGCIAALISTFARKKGSDVAAKEANPKGWSIIRGRKKVNLSANLLFHAGKFDRDKFAGLLIFFSLSVFSSLEVLILGNTRRYSFILLLFNSQILCGAILQHFCGINLNIFIFTIKLTVNK